MTKFLFVNGEIFLHSSKISPFRCALVEMTAIFLKVLLIACQRICFKCLTRRFDDLFRFIGRLNVTNSIEL